MISKLRSRTLRISNGRQSTADTLAIANVTNAKTLQKHSANEDNSHYQ